MTPARDHAARASAEDNGVQLKTRGVARKGLTLVAVATCLAGCGSVSPQKPPTGTASAKPETRTRPVPNSTVRAKRTSELKRAGGQQTVPGFYTGQGTAPSQVFVGLTQRSCIGITGAYVLPGPSGGRTTVQLTVHGLTGRATGFSATQTLVYGNDADPAVALGRLGQIRSGRYEIIGRFAGDSRRKRSTARRTVRIPGGC